MKIYDLEWLFQYGYLCIQISYVAADKSAAYDIIFITASTQLMHSKKIEDKIVKEK